MLKTKNFKFAQLAFIACISILYIMSYSVYAYADNLVQFFIFKHHLSINEYPNLYLISMSLIAIIMGICIFKKFQQLNYQRYVLTILILSLIFIPSTLKTFPVISAFSDSILTLSGAWYQFYAPPAVRATIAGINSGILSVIDLRSIEVESHLHMVLIIYRYVILSLLVCLIFFWKYSLALKDAPITTKQMRAPPEKVFKLLINYPYIFIIAIFCGFNGAIFYFSYFLGKEIIPTPDLKTYQYCMCIGSIFTPMIVGRIADKNGIFRTFLWIGGCLALIKLVSGILFMFSIKSNMVYYILVFIEAGLAGSLWSIESSLMGEKLCSKGIFRAFAISNLFYSLGGSIASRVYDLCAPSFQLTKISFTCIDILLLLLIFYCSKNKKLSMPNQNNQ